MCLQITVIEDENTLHCTCTRKIKKILIASTLGKHDVKKNNTICFFVMTVLDK